MPDREVYMKKKLYIFFAVITVIGVLVLVDYFRYAQVEVIVKSISPQPAQADSSKTVTISVKLQDTNGKPLVNHNLFALTLGGGSWKSYREKTDKNGLATFIYYPYLANDYQQITDVNIEIRDESNSLFVEMYPTKKIKIKMIRPQKNSNQDTTVDSFLN